MIVFGKSVKKTGGKRQHPVRKLSASTAEDFEVLLKALKGLDGEWWGHWPTVVQPWNYTDKRTPHVWLRETRLAEVVRRTGAVELPDSYLEFVIFKLKRQFWEELWQGHGEELTGKASKYWREKLRWAAGRIVREGEWVSVPETYVPDTPCDEDLLIVGLKMINSWVENLSLGHRNRLNPPSDKGAGSLSALPANLRAYYSLPPEKRESYLGDHPWLIPMVEERQAQGLFSKEDFFRVK